MQGPGPFCTYGVRGWRVIQPGERVATLSDVQRCQRGVPTQKIFTDSFNHGCPCWPSVSQVGPLLAERHQNLQPRPGGDHSPTRWRCPRLPTEIPDRQAPAGVHAAQYRGPQPTAIIAGRTCVRQSTLQPLDANACATVAADGTGYGLADGGSGPFK